MRLNGNGRANGSAPMPPLMTDQQHELAVERELDERSERDSLSDILTRANQTPDGTQRLKEIVSGITREPQEPEIRDRGVAADGGEVARIDVAEGRRRLNSKTVERPECNDGPCHRSHHCPR